MMRAGTHNGRAPKGTPNFQDFDDKHGGGEVSLRGLAQAGC
jgi:hypothetical protein